MSLADILGANYIYIQTLDKFMPQWIKDPNYKQGKQYQALQNYGKQIIANFLKWSQRQRELERRGKVPPFPHEIQKELFQKKYLDDIKKRALSYALGKNADATMKGQGLGIIPLIIWGVVAIVAAFTVEEIVDETHETNEERADLLEATKKFSQDMKLTPEQTTAIVQGQQQAEIKQTENSGGGFFSSLPVLPLLGAAALFMFLNNKKSKSE